jgi:tRNA(His) 5'-end guanylyltransferase
MKKYEESVNFRMIPRLPIIIRVDGKAFSRLTKKLKLAKPYDETFMGWMADAAVHVASEMQGCVLAYTQSDEITFVVRTDQSNETTPWFDNRIQKITSVSSSITTAAFNRLLYPWYKENFDGAIPSLAFFDSRVTPYPNMVEVVNCLIWRQQDCTKNSIGSACYYEVARHEENGKTIGRGTTRKMMHKLNQDQRQELLFSKTGINWNNYPAEFKRGIVAFRESRTVVTKFGTAIRKKWVWKAAPIFTSEEGREWLNVVLNPLQEERDGKEEEKEA